MTGTTTEEEKETDMTDRDALIRRIARHEFPDPRVVRQSDHRGHERPAQTPRQATQRPPAEARDEHRPPTGPTPV